MKFDFNIEIECDGYGISIGKDDDCYCEPCIDKRDDDISDLEKKVESLKGQIVELEEEITNLQNVINSA